VSDQAAGGERTVAREPVRDRDNFGSYCSLSWIPM
jgi:hypothetical protein